MNKHTRFLTALTAIATGGVVSALACTSLIATRGATTDGSVIATYAADSHTLYGELYSAPESDHAKGSMRTVTEWDTGRHIGQIPQPHILFLLWAT